MKRRPQSAAIGKFIQPTKSEPSVIPNQEIKSIENMSQLMLIKKSPKPTSPPNQFFEDKETLYFQNRKFKQETNDVKYENIKLKTRINQLQKQIFKIEKTDRYQRKVDPLGMYATSDEGSIIPMLKTKIREQATIIKELEESLRNQCKSVKLTSLVELQKEIKNQQDEILNLKLINQAVLKITDQDLYNDPTIIERMKNLIQMISKYDEEMNILQNQNDILKNEYQELIDNHIKAKEDLQTLAFEKIQLKKKLEDQVITETEQYQLKKREFVEKKLQETLAQVDSLKGELSLYENKCRFLTKQLKEQEIEYKQTIISTQKAKQHLEEQVLKKDTLIQDLQERVLIYDLLKQKSRNEESIEPVVKYIIPPKTYRDSITQFPEQEILLIKPTDIINAIPLDKEILKVLLENLSYKVISMCLTKERLKYIFKKKEFIQLKYAIDIFQKEPFNFSENDALILSRYLIGEDQGQGYKIQYEDTQNTIDLIQKIIPSRENLKFNFKTTLKRNKIIKQLYCGLSRLKMKNSIYNVDEYVLYLKNNSFFTEEQINTIRMINLLYLGDPHNINQEFILSYLKEECQMLANLNNLQQIDFLIYHSIPKLQIQKSLDLEDSFSKGMNSNVTKITNIQDNQKYNQIQSTQPPLIDQQILTISQFQNTDRSLKNSEQRKPFGINSGKDSLTYSQSCVESIIQIKKPTDSVTQGGSLFKSNSESVIFNQDKSKSSQQTQQMPIIDELSSIDGLVQPPSLLNNNKSDTQNEQIEEEVYYEEL